MYQCTYIHSRKIVWRYISSPCQIYEKRVLEFYFDNSLSTGMYGTTYASIWYLLCVHKMMSTFSINVNEKSEYEYALYIYLAIEKRILYSVGWNR